MYLEGYKVDYHTPLFISHTNLWVWIRDYKKDKKDENCLSEFVEPDIWDRLENPYLCRKDYPYGCPPFLNCKFYKTKEDAVLALRKFLSNVK